MENGIEVLSKFALYGRDLLSGLIASLSDFGYGAWPTNQKFKEFGILSTVSLRLKMTDRARASIKQHGSS